MEEHSPQADSLELVDLGDAIEETRQTTPVPIIPDSRFGQHELSRT